MYFSETVIGYNKFLSNCLRFYCVYKKHNKNNKKTINTKTKKNKL